MGRPMCVECGGLVKRVEGYTMTMRWTAWWEHTEKWRGEKCEKYPLNVQNVPHQMRLWGKVGQ